MLNWRVEWRKWGAKQTLRICRERNRPEFCDLRTGLYEVETGLRPINEIESGKISVLS
ncbi:hypothetical protein GJW-30_1_02007 [Variibacter gotjawalensis]|uniref:Uncharacterized protein n=1 Tax=Variibacter gotjawalensis TaxID=1333996 RepID=A0A0S3PUA3_9BRAD|nr:hypothetical protein [Variibacter gotjawalensis]RZS45801.1 hypothetical protein EV661_4125 [Variibacter gotjawalensis]BAT59474.1 hypothetical protein GJW-30_1_02007 [Variibacter gotjawalensis]